MPFPEWVTALEKKLPKLASTLRFVLAAATTAEGELAGTPAPGARDAKLKPGAKKGDAKAAAEVSATVFRSCSRACCTCAVLMDPEP